MSEKTTEIFCHYCHNAFQISAKKYRYQSSKFPDKKFYCSTQCVHLSQTIWSKINVKCDNCGVDFDKLDRYIEKTNHNFCGHSCRAIFINKNRFVNGYSTKDKKKTIVCVDCGINIEVSLHATIATSRCVSCKQKFLQQRKQKRCERKRCVRKRCVRKRKERSNDISHYRKRSLKCNKICAACKELLVFNENTHNVYAKYCNTCRQLAYHKAGMALSRSQEGGKRSRGEIYFAELCSIYFNDILINSDYFVDKIGRIWDADIIIPQLKIAVLYNGFRHYKKIGDGKSLQKTIIRDKIKHEAIIANGFEPYVIKDMNRFDPKFVEREFSIFLAYIQQMSTSNPDL